MVYERTAFLKPLRVRGTSCNRLKNRHLILTVPLQEPTATRIISRGLPVDGFWDAGRTHGKILSRIAKYPGGLYQIVVVYGMKSSAEVFPQSRWCRCQNLGITIFPLSERSSKTFNLSRRFLFPQLLPVENRFQNATKQLMSEWKPFLDLSNAAPRDILLCQS